MKEETFTLNQQSAKTKHHKLLHSQGLEAGEQGDTDKRMKWGRDNLKKFKIIVCKIEGSPLFLSSLYWYHSK